MYKQIEKCCVQLNGLLIDGMRVIDVDRAGIALVVDDQGCLRGTLTDGDIRRALLKGAFMESPLAPYVQCHFTAVGPEASRAEVLDLMQARTLNQVPILDKNGRLLGLHLLHEIIGAVERPNWAVVMAGGKGTRLHPITEHLPKSMIKVAGRPILERLVLHLVSFGIKRIFLAINYKGEVIEEYFGNGARFGCQVEYLRETMVLGTGGPISLLLEKPVHPLVVLNGDLVTQVNLDRLLGFHSNGKFFATMGVRRYSHQVPFGCVELDDDRISRFQEKPVLEQFVNAGVYVLSPEAVVRVPKMAFPITEVFEKSLKLGEPLGAFEIKEEWTDVGVYDQLKQARDGTI